jgi:hypothetical protein
LLILIRIFVRKKEMNMKRIYWLFLATLVIIAQYSCGSQDKTYGEQKRHEREVVSSFINRNVVMVVGNDTLLNLGKIKVITEEEFEKQDSTTDASKNEFVLFPNTGVYMQIVREGVGKRIEMGENCRLICRFWEYNIMGDSLQLSNRIPMYATRPEYINVSNNSGYINGSFDLTVPTGSLMNQTYGDTDVPDGWLKPLQYIRVGAQTDERRIAKVRLIVPHSAGQSHAMASVYPCFYELTFQER